MKSEERKKVAVIIPAWKPDRKFSVLIERLQRQTILPERILVINTEEAYFRDELIRDWNGISVMHIGKEQFDHAGTRNMGARMCGEDYLLFMTMDAVPADRYLIEHLLEAFEEPVPEASGVAAVYARQLPRKDSDPVERAVRVFNYPARSRVQSLEDTAAIGVKAFFCSNVCAVYRRDLFFSLGGFESPAIFNEDMVFAAKALEAGYKIVYCAEAKVYHSHNYSAVKQFHRNFDLGVSQKQHPEIFEKIRSEGAGVEMIRKVSKELLQTGHLMSLPVLYWQSAWKYLGYRAGKAYEHIPEFLVRKLSMNREYWNK